MSAAYFNCMSKQASQQVDLCNIMKFDDITCLQTRFAGHSIKKSVKVSISVSLLCFLIVFILPVFDTFTNNYLCQYLQCFLLALLTNSEQCILCSWLSESSMFMWCYLTAAGHRWRWWWTSCITHKSQFKFNILTSWQHGLHSQLQWVWQFWNGWQLYGVRCWHIHYRYAVFFGGTSWWRHVSICSTTSCSNQRSCSAEMPRNAVSCSENPSWVFR